MARHFRGKANDRPAFLPHPNGEFRILTGKQFRIETAGHRVRGGPDQNIASEVVDVSSRRIPLQIAKPDKNGSAGKAFPPPSADRAYFRTSRQFRLGKSQPSLRQLAIAVNELNCVQSGIPVEQELETRMTCTGWGVRRVELEHLGAEGASQHGTSIDGFGIDVHHRVALAKRCRKTEPEPLAFVTSDHYDGRRQDVLHVS